MSIEHAVFEELVDVRSRREDAKNAYEVAVLCDQHPPESEIVNLSHWPAPRSAIASLLNHFTSLPA